MTRQQGIAAGIVALVLAIVVWYFWPVAEPEPVPAPVASAPAPASVAPEPTGEVLPALVDSDAWVREQLAGVLLQGPLGEALAAPDVMRRFVAATDAIATGGDLHRHLAFLAPGGDFDVVEVGDRLIATPATLARYDTAAAAMSALPAAAVVDFYRRTERLADAAYAELVGEARPFRPVLLRALRVLLAVEVPSRPPDLDDAINRFVYRNPNYEDLSLPQKHMLRLGADNQRAVQTKLAEIERLVAALD